jgi:hypothetical protein
MNVDILKNDDHWQFKDPPGSSVLDPIEHLVVYSMFILSHSRFDLFNDFLDCFKQAFPSIPPLNRKQCELLQDVIDSYVIQNKNLIKENICYILEILGLLPSKIQDMPDLKLSTTRILLEEATYYIKYYLFVGE